jgi:hypothetical protein
MKSVYSAVRIVSLNEAVCASFSKASYNRDESVYSAVRTGSLIEAVCALSLKGFYNRDEKCLQRGTGWVFK